MPMPEQRFTPRDPEFALLGLANMFFRRNFTNSIRGLQEATTALKAQHEKVMPPMSQINLLAVVAQQDFLVQTTKQMAALALAEDDFEAALFVVNHLFAYGEIDFQEFSGTKGAFDHSLNTHRDFADRIRGKFLKVDPYLASAGKEIFAEIEELRSQGDFHQELGLLRGIIHMTALNGTLSEDTKQYFDPYAIVRIE